ncbi:hypothetical protein ACJ73_06040, partial [Blastomyces percursus]
PVNYRGLQTFSGTSKLQGLQVLKNYPLGAWWNIYGIENYRSASKIELKLYLAVHTIWINVRRNDFDPDVWGINGVDKAKTKLPKELWEKFLEEILPTNELLSIPNLGSWSFV